MKRKVGRPKGDRVTVLFGVRCETGLATRVRALSESKGVTRNQLINELLEAEVSRHERFSERG